MNKAITFCLLLTGCGSFDFETVYGTKVYVYTSTPEHNIEDMVNVIYGVDAALLAQTLDKPLSRVIYPWQHHYLELEPHKITDCGGYSEVLGCFGGKTAQVYHFYRTDDVPHCWHPVLAHEAIHQSLSRLHPEKNDHKDPQIWFTFYQSFESVEYKAATFLNSFYCTDKALEQYAPPAQTPTEQPPTNTATNALTARSNNDIISTLSAIYDNCPHTKSSAPNLP